MIHRVAAPLIYCYCLLTGMNSCYYDTNRELRISIAKRRAEVKDLLRRVEILQVRANRIEFDFSVYLTLLTATEHNEVKYLGKIPMTFGLGGNEKFRKNFNETFPPCPTCGKAKGIKGSCQDPFHADVPKLNDGQMKQASLSKVLLKEVEDDNGPDPDYDF